MTEFIIQKTCSLCFQLLPTSIFTKNKDGKDGYRNQCKPCYNKRRSLKKYQVAELKTTWDCLNCGQSIPKGKTGKRLYCDKCGKERLLLIKRQDNAKWRKANPEQYKKRQKDYYEKNYCEPQYKEARNKRLREIAREMRVTIIQTYGGKCSCCNETTREFLSIDHINGGGAADRKKFGNYITFYRWIIKNHFPQHLRILCHNCNQAFGFYGYCPHQK
ncbi:MAG TPA: hypothetical protein VK308_05665 [Pyrinomonadaceae bacterium]|nr:hypothetical protein [Pyrinomonadaceae bacterium]